MIPEREALRRFELSPTLDLERLAEAYRSTGRLQVKDFLEGGMAKALYQELAETADWRLTANKGAEVHHFALDDMRAWTPAQHELLDRAVQLGGRYDFQFRYDVIRLERTTCRLLAAFRDFMSSPEMIAAMRKITGHEDIGFADAHASRYRPGHFLTSHDDQADSMGRRAAYVLNLTPEWRPDWGGLLQFYGSDGNVTRGFTPGFNVLNLFRVPQAHSVSWVNPLAAAPRFAVTGWLRAPMQSGAEESRG